MAVEADKLVIVNAALVLIGDEKITSLSSVDPGEAEDLANALYEIRLEEALSLARWRFATRQVLLVANVTAPLGRWTSAYDLPDGVVVAADPEPMTINAVTVDDVPIPFDRYENQLFTNSDTVNDVLILDYSFRALEADWTGRFKGAFVDLLASDYAMSKDLELAQGLARSAFGKFKTAASMDAQERTAKKLPVQKFINARGGWARGQTSAFGPVGGGGGGVTNGDYGDITVLNGAWTINAGAVELAMLDDQAIGEMLYFGTAGAPTILAAGTNGLVLKMTAGIPSWETENSGSTLADADYGDITVTGTGTVLTIDDEAVTLAKMAHMATASVLGRATAATGDVEVLTTTQLTALIDEVTSSLSGAAPASGGGTTNYLRADGTWAAPPGTDALATATGIFREEQTSGTDGGTYTATARATRVLNTTVKNDIGVTLTANTLTGLVAGTYFCIARSPMYRVVGHQAILYDVTGAADLLVGSSAESRNGSDTNPTDSLIHGFFTIGVTSTVRLECEGDVTRSTDGLGRGAGRGNTEVFSTLMITKVA